MDRRELFSGNQQLDVSNEDIVKKLSKVGGTCTFQVNLDFYNQNGFEGFRYFRILQIGKNSSGSDNLALSGLEMYGYLHNKRF